MNGKVTKKQQLFIEEYLIDLNATQAAIRAGYSKKTAYRTGADNLKKPQVQAAIKKALAERSERTQISADYVLQSLKEVADTCRAIDEDTGKLRDASGANRALELIGKHLKLFTNKTEITGKDNEPLVTVAGPMLMPIDEWEKMVARERSKN